MKQLKPELVENLPETEIQTDRVVGRLFAGIKGEPKEVQVGSKIELSFGFDLNEEVSEAMLFSVSIIAPGFIMNRKRDRVLIKRLPIKKGEKNNSMVLKFQALNLGKHIVSVDFFIKNGYLLTLEIPITVIS